MLQLRVCGRVGSRTAVRRYDCLARCLAFVPESVKREGTVPDQADANEYQL
jgi:hypothetical protein